MNKICTSIEQGQKLMELGIDVNTADMWYSYYGNSKYNPTIAYKGQQWFLCQIRNSSRDIPAWSLSALLSLLKPYGSDTYTMWGTLNGGAGIEFADLTDVCFQEDNPLDAVFEMIAYLKENNKI